MVGFEYLDLHELTVSALGYVALGELGHHVLVVVLLRVLVVVVLDQAEDDALLRTRWVIACGMMY